MRPSPPVIAPLAASIAAVDGSPCVAAPGAKDSRQRGGPTVRSAPRLSLLICLLTALGGLMALATSAQAAARFSWYGENNSTCWSSNGAVEAEAPKECDYVGEWFLNSSNPVRTLEGSINGDLGYLTQSGDYCNSYSGNKATGPLYTRDENNESGLTGFNPSPKDSMTTANGDFLCQAAGAQWGQGLRPGHIGGCVGEYQPCGIHHTVTFVGQRQSIRPWSRAFTSPILIVEGAAYPGRINVPGGGWAYLCPVLEDVGSSNGQLLEYCFVEWEKSGYVNFRGLVNQAPISAIAGIPPATHRMCQLFTAFQLGTTFSTEIAGSGNTYTIGESPWIGPFKAGITEGNLLNAIRAANSPPCSEGDSEDLTKYALIGVEQGIEGGNIAEFGARTENLALSTEYWGLNVAPKAATQPTNEWKATSAEVHGSVNPEGSSTEAYFEYSTEPSFAHSTKAPTAGWQIGSGMTYIPAYITIEGLTPNTTYYDRVVGHNASGTTYGGPAQFHTLASPPTVSTGSATATSETQASLHGTVNPNASDTHYHFQYGETTSYGASTTEVDAGSGTASVPVESIASGLQPNTAYHYRIVASNSFGTSYGEDRIFDPAAPTYVSGFGSEGSGNGQFKHPGDIANDSRGNLWVVDHANNRVEEFNEKGEYIKAFGSQGAGNGQLNEPDGIAIDTTANIWIADTNNSRIEEFNERGEFLRAVGSEGAGNGQFKRPEGIAVDNHNNVWVSDTYNGRLEEFNEKGEFLKTVGTKGSGVGQIGEPEGLAVGANGVVWVTDWPNNRVEEFSEAGEYVTEFGTEGSGNGQLKRPYGIALDANGKAWVADTLNNRVEAFNAKGEYVTQFGSPGGGDGQFNFSYPIGLAINANGEAWVTDPNNNRVEKWLLPGTVAPPTVTKLKPTSGPTTGGTTVTITGTGLTTATTVKFGGVAASRFEVLSATSITAVAPPEAAGVADVTVTTRGGTSGLVTADRFKFIPEVTSVTPNTGTIAGGSVVTVRGSGFAVGQTGTTFKFGTAAGTAVNCAASTECVVTSPAGAVGPVDVKATVNKQVSPKVAADRFTYS